MNTNKSNNIVLFNGLDSASVEPIINNLSKSHKVDVISVQNSTLKSETQRLYNMFPSSTEPFVLISNSFNAFIAILFAERHPRLVKHIILLGCPSFDDEHADLNYASVKSEIIMELLELRRNRKLLDAIKHVKSPITFIHGKQDINPYQGVQDVLNDNDVDFEFILFDKCGSAPWNDDAKSESFFKMLNVLVNEF